MENSKEKENNLWFYREYLELAQISAELILKVKDSEFIQKQKDFIALCLQRAKVYKDNLKQYE